MEKFGTKFYMFGGVKNYVGATNETWAFDYLKEEWEFIESNNFFFFYCFFFYRFFVKAPTKPSPRMFHLSAVVGDVMIISGGSPTFSGGRLLSDFWMFHLCGEKKHTWERLKFTIPIKNFAVHG